MAFVLDGERYQAASAHQKEWGGRLIEELDLRGDERVLDLGCGDGLLTAQLAACVPDGSVVGIDASPSMLAVAQSLAGGNLAFRLLDIDDLAFEAEFDLIYSNAALHWVLDHRRLLANCRRALRSGGLMRTNFAGQGNCATFFWIVRQAMDEALYAPHFACFTWPYYMPAVEAYQRLVDEAGFAEARVWGENVDRHFPEAEAMVRWIDQPSLVPFLAALPEPLKQPFRDLVVREMIEATRQGDGSCFETFRRINLLARKS